MERCVAAQGVEDLERYFSVGRDLRHRERLPHPYRPSGDGKIRAGAGESSPLPIVLLANGTILASGERGSKFFSAEVEMLGPSPIVFLPRTILAGWAG
jgi:hypothetical protein